MVVVQSGIQIAVFQFTEDVLFEALMVYVLLPWGGERTNMWLPRKKSEHKNVAGLYFITLVK